MAFGGWAATRTTRPRGSLLVGVLVATLAIAIPLAAAYSFVAPMMDVQSVAIAIGWTDAPDAPVGPDLPVEAELEQGLVDSDSSGPFGGPAWQVVQTIVFLVVVIAVVVLAGVFGAALNRRRSGTAAPSERALWSLGMMTASIVVLSAVLWSNVWTTANALVDFDQSAGPDMGVNLSEVAGHHEVMQGRTVTKGWSNTCRKMLLWFRHRPHLANVFSHAGDDSFLETFMSKYIPFVDMIEEGTDPACTTTMIPKGTGQAS